MSLPRLPRPSQHRDPGVAKDALPPGLQNHPIRATFAPPDRRLTFSLSIGAMLLLTASTVYLTILSQRCHLQPPQDRLQTVSLVMDEGGDGQPAGPSAPAGGGKADDVLDHADQEPLSILNALTPRLTPPDDPIEPPEQVPDRVRDLSTLQPGLIPAPVAGQGNGIGSGLGSEVGNGLGAGLGHGHGSVWIHSAHGDEQLKVAVNFMDLTDYIPPIYPDEAKAKHISGDVIMAVTIDASGTPIKWSVVQGEPLLAAATLKVFPKWHFVPPVYKGEKVSASFEVRIRFMLV